MEVKLTILHLMGPEVCVHGHAESRKFNPSKIIMVFSSGNADSNLDTKTCRKTYKTREEATSKHKFGISAQSRFFALLIFVLCLLGLFHPKEFAIKFSQAILVFQVMINFSSGTGYMTSQRSHFMT